MKRGTTPTLLIKIGVEPDIIQEIIFLFKQKCSETAEATLTKVYPSEFVTYSDGVYHVRWTQEETRLFDEELLFYMDTRIVLTDGKIPETRIVTLKMNKTLFEED